MREYEQSFEYHAGPKNGSVDFGSLRVVKDVADSIPHLGFETKTITFSEEHMHSGLIAVALIEALQLFEDTGVDSLNVSPKTLAILESLGIPYEQAVAASDHQGENDISHDILHREDVFVYQPMTLRTTGD